MVEVKTPTPTPTPTPSPTPKETPIALGPPTPTPTPKPRTFKLPKTTLMDKIRYYWDKLNPKPPKEYYNETLMKYSIGPYSKDFCYP